MLVHTNLKNSSATPTGTKTYILRSKLDPRLIQMAATPDDDILRIEQADLRGDEQHAVDDDEAEISEPTGAIIAWERGDQLQSVGLLYVILSLILVHGRTIADSTCFVRSMYAPSVTLLLSFRRSTDSAPSSTPYVEFSNTPQFALSPSVLHARAVPLTSHPARVPRPPTRG